MDTTKFVNRHVGIAAEDLPAMLKAIGVHSLDELIDQTIPSNIRLKHDIKYFIFGCQFVDMLSKFTFCHRFRQIDVVF